MSEQINWARCPLCKSSEVVRLPEQWQQEVGDGGFLPIVGCGNPWHYATRSLGDGAAKPAASPADEVAGQAMTLTAELREAYTLLVSSEPTLIRDARTAPNPTSAHFKTILRDRVTEWVDRYRGDLDGGLARRLASPARDATSGGAT